VWNAAALCSIQLDRFNNTSVTSNAAMPPRLVRQHCQLDAESSSYLRPAMEQMNFSAQAHDGILKVARTLADLSGSDAIGSGHFRRRFSIGSRSRGVFP